MSSFFFLAHVVSALLLKLDSSSVVTQCALGAWRMMLDMQLQLQQ